MRRTAVTVVLALVAVAAGIVAAPDGSVATAQGGDTGAASPSSAPTVGMVGDSLTVQSAGEIRSSVGQNHQLVYLNAVNRATIAGQRQSVVNAVRAPGGPDILLIALGSNDAGQNHGLGRFVTDVHAMLSEVTPHVDAVVWFDLKNRANPWYADYNYLAPYFNRALRQVVAEYPKAWVAEYSVWADAVGSGAFLSDLLHLGSWGRRDLGWMAEQAADGFDPARRSGPYWDVRDTYWAATAINWTGAHGLTTGYPNGTYRAVLGSVQFHVTRGQMARMLWVANGSPTGYPGNRWTDRAQWIAGPLDWLSATGHATGYPDGTFRPNANITRAELARMLYRIAGWPDVSGLPPHGFSDVPPWVEVAVRWIRGIGVVFGYPDGTFRPNALVTRAQVASWLYHLSSAPLVEATPPAADPAAPAVPPSSVPAPDEPTTTVAPGPAVPVPPTSAAPTTTTAPPVVSGP